MKKVLGWTLSALIVVLLVGYLASPIVGAHYSARYLERLGLREVSLKLALPGLGELTAPRLRFSWADEQVQYRVELKGITASYQLLKLIRQGRLQQLSVAEVNVTTRTMDSMDQVKPGPPAPSGLPLPGEWIRNFPIDQIEIHQGTLQEYSSKPKSAPIFKLSGTLSHQSDRLAGDFRFGAGALQARALLEMHADGVLQIRLRRPQQNKDLMQIKTRLRLSDGNRLETKGTLDVDVSELRHLDLLETMTDLPETLHGHMVVNWQGNIAPTVPEDWTDVLHSADLDGVLHADLNSDVAGVGTGIRVKGHSKFTIRAGTVVFEAEPNLVLRGRWLLPGETASVSGQGNTSEVRFTNGLSGHFSVQPTSYSLVFNPGAVIEVRDFQWNDFLLPKLSLTHHQTSVFAYDRNRHIWQRQYLALTGQIPQVDHDLTALGKIENVKFRAQLMRQPDTDRAVIRIREASVDIFDGTLSSDQIEIDTDRNDNRFVVFVQGADLARIVQLEQQGELQASGRIDGILPVVWGPDALLVKSGTLSARPPGGVISYRPDAQAKAFVKSNQGLALVTGALSDLRYHSLDMKIDYLENGDLHLKLALKGSNPNWQNGQPIHLNINVQENIPALLKSLGLSDKLSQQIEKRMRKGSPDP